MFWMWNFTHSSYQVQTFSLSNLTRWYWSCKYSFLPHPKIKISYPNSQPTLHLQGRMSPCPLAQCDARTAIRLTMVRTSLPRPQNSCNSTPSQSIARGCLPWVPLDPSSSLHHRDKLQPISSRWMMWVDADQRRLTLNMPKSQICTT